jgi:hypothetical protein
MPRILLGPLRAATQCSPAILASESFNGFLNGIYAISTKAVYYNGAKHRIPYA